LFWRNFPGGYALAGLGHSTDYLSKNNLSEIVLRPAERLRQSHTGCGVELFSKNNSGEIFQEKRPNI